MSEQLPPSDIEAERAVLGAMLSGAADDGLTKLAADDFFAIAHREIFAAIEELHSKGKTADVISVRSSVPQYSEELLECDGFPHLIGQYADIVYEKARLRRIIDTCHLAESRAYLGEDTSDDVIQAMARLDRTRATRTVASMLDERLASYLVRQPYFSPMGSTVKIHPSDLTVIGGRPGTGKTALTLWWAADLAKRMKVAFYSYEMSEDEVMDRLIAMHTNMPSDFAFSGLTETELESYRSGTEGIRGLDLSVKVSAGMRLSQLYSSLRRFRASGGQVAVIDYLQLAVERTSEGMTQDVSRLTKELRRIALDSNLSIIVVSQLNREAAGREGEVRLPCLQDLRDSGSIEQDAVSVCLMYEMPESESGSKFLAKNVYGKYAYGWREEPLIRLDWAKTRHQRRRVEYAYFNGATSTFSFLDRL